MAKLLQQPTLVLASGSIYRQELLSRLRFQFTAISPDIDETALPAEAPQDTALRLAQSKAEAVSDRLPECIIIGSDQVALLDGEQLGKPGSHANALAQLLKMQGREVHFHTALCLLDGRASNKSTRIQLANIETAVKFRRLPENQLDAYLRIEQPYDCAGSAKNEGLGIALIESIVSNDPTALTGLPLIALTTMLRNAGFSFFSATP
ncbi:Maf family nucleotide pyrophosphatase [Actimicrobium sp. GrIS 1.19]|uniref:Maf family nucleotide pyrophosphatase n=1 Tax=Actimicrobium sp. GrIS 1.19 TaxID=3071708 RepID=UPI002E106B74